MFKLIGENNLTGNKWECVTDIATRKEADELCNGWRKLEWDYKISYYVEEQ